jgi:hypothetical protein
MGEEQTFFAICGVPWIEPFRRTQEMLYRVLRMTGP